MPARISEVGLDAINRQLGLLDTRLSEALENFDALRRGDLAFTGNPDFGGFRLTNTSDAESDDDALTLGELLERMDDIEEEASQLETSAAEDYAGGGRQKRLLKRTSRLKDQISDEVANIISALGFPAVVFTQDDGAGNAELATDTTNFVWDNTNNRLGLGTATPTERLHVSGGNVRIDTLTLGSVLFAGTGGVISQDNANFFWDDTNNRLGLGTASPQARLHAVIGAGVLPAISTETAILIQNNSAATDSANLTIIAGASDHSQILFGDAAQEEIGAIRYSHTTNRLDFRANNNTEATVFSSGGVGGMFLGPSGGTGTARLHVSEGATDLVRVTDSVNNLFEVLQLETVVNNAGLATHDFRVEGDTLTHLVFVDASADRVSIGDSTPDNFFTVGTTSQFQVGTDGDLDRIKDVPYTWPAAQGAASTFLQNDGAGVLSWVTAGGAGLVSGTGTATQVAYWSSATNITSETAVDPGSFTWNATDNRLGVRIALPLEALHVVGNAIVTGIVYGGTAAGDNLDLDPSSASNYTGSIRFNTTATDYGSVAIDSVRLWPNGFTHGGSAAGEIISGVRFSSTVTIDASDLSVINMFNFEPTVTNSAGVTTMPQTIGYNCSMTINNAQAATAVAGVATVGFQFSPAYTVTGGGGATMSAANVRGFRSAPINLGTSMTVTTWRDFDASEFTTFGGTLTTRVGYDCSFTNGTTPISFRSSGTAVQMRHAGPAVFGANSPVTAATTLEVAASATSSFRNSTRTIFPPTANQVIDAAADTILANATFINLTNTTGASITLTSAPTIADGEDGMYLIIMNIAADNIVVQDQGTLAGSNLRLGAATRTLGTRDNLVLIYSADIGDWVEVSFNNVV